MLTSLALIPFLPLAGFLILIIGEERLSKRVSAVVGVGSVALAALLTLLVGFNFVTTPPAGYEYTQTVWHWITVGSFTPEIAFHLDSLSLLMIAVVTGVGTLIHLYSVTFMRDDDGFIRFFAYMNLFISMMLILLLADNLLLMYLGWEGVGLCSYLLIGFWYRDPNNGRAARKAFIVTRVGDTFLAIGLFLLFATFGTLQIQALSQQMPQVWATGSTAATVAALLLLGGAVGKSAQLPLQIWLPDAMAGPTPVSALIHAATMVTAGVYLIARTHVLFLLAPAALSLVAVIGALTLLLAGFSALTQRDIKRVLAYSTMSQIGYMFLALGVGAWSAALFHFMTHAFFKALLFLCAGIIIQRLDEEHDMFKMGGLWKRMPIVFWTFLIGASSLAALPLITAGFYSKDAVLWGAWASGNGSPWLWGAGIVGALLTALYTFRMVFVTFFGEPGELVRERAPFVTAHINFALPLVVLAALSVVAGWLDLPPALGNQPVLSRFLEHTLPAMQVANTAAVGQGTLQIIASVVSLLGVALAYVFYMRMPDKVARWSQTASLGSLRQFWFGDWGFDNVANRGLINPYVQVAQTLKDDPIDTLFMGLAHITEALWNALRATENGQLRRYALGVGIGAALIIALVVLE